MEDTGNVGVIHNPVYGTDVQADHESKEEEVMYHVYMTLFHS